MSVAFTYIFLPARHQTSPSPFYLPWLMLHCTHLCYSTSRRHPLDFSYLSRQRPGHPCTSGTDSLGYPGIPLMSTLTTGRPSGRPHVISRYILEPTPDTRATPSLPSSTFPIHDLSCPDVPDESRRPVPRISSTAVSVPPYLCAFTRYLHAPFGDGRRSSLQIPTSTTPPETMHTIYSERRRSTTDGHTSGRSA